MKVPQSVRWTYIRHGITKNPTRFLSIVFTKWVMDCAIHNGYVDVYVLTDGGCAASFDIKKTAWHCGVPGGDLTIVVNPDMLGGNCSDWRDLHASDHCVADLVAARDASARQDEPAEHGSARCCGCSGPLVDFEFGSLCAICAEDLGVAY